MGSISRGEVEESLVCSYRHRRVETGDEESVLLYEMTCRDISGVWLASKRKLQNCIDYTHTTNTHTRTDRKQSGRKLSTVSTAVPFGD